MSFGTWLKHFKTEDDKEIIELKVVLKDLCVKYQCASSYFTHASTFFKILDIEPNERIVTMWEKDRLLTTNYLY